MINSTFLRTLKSSALVTVTLLLLNLAPQTTCAHGGGHSHGKTDEHSAEYNEMISKASSNISFMENKGQWPSHILYRADVSGAQMLATKEGMLVGKYDLQSLSELNEYMDQLEEISAKKRDPKDLMPEPLLKGHGWRFKFLNGNMADFSNVTKKGESQDYYNFLLGDQSTHATNVRSYKELTYTGVYAGVDVRYYTDPIGNFENDIVVHPGAATNNIKLQIEGVDRVELDENGELSFMTTVGEIIVPAPISYLLDEKGNKTSIDVDFILNADNTISFKVPSYDKTKTLVIDPIVLRWGTYLSGNSSSDAHYHGVDLDAQGNIYVTGRYNNNLITVGAFQSANAGGTDLFIGKYNEPATPGGTGTRVWQTYLGGSGTDFTYAITVGLDGFVYACGTTSSNLPKTFGTGFTAGSWTQRTGAQTFIAKVHPNGTGAAVRQIGSASGSWDPLFYDLRVIPTTGNNFDILAVGTATQSATGGSGDIPQAILPNGTANTTTGHENGYAIRITSNLETISWARCYSSTGGSSDAFNIAVADGPNSLTIGGTTSGNSGISHNNPSTQTTLIGTSNGWILRLNATTGDASWSRYFNSTSGNSNNILCMEMNRTNTQIIIGGRALGAMASTNITAGAYQTTYGGSTADFYVASIPVSGATTTWGTYFGGSGNEVNMMGLNVDQTMTSMYWVILLVKIFLWWIIHCRMLPMMLLTRMLFSSN
jgi:hypothetical protein